MSPARRTPRSAPRRKTQPPPEAAWPGLRARLDHLARNLWWTWRPEARLLLESIDPALWEATNHNPVAVLDRLDPERARALASDPRFAENLRIAENHLEQYLTARTWFERSHRGKARSMLAAYYCMEYGLHESLPLYAGGLGILAADHLKSASDLGVPLVAVGILWKHGYYRQELDGDGRTRVLYPAADFGLLPIDDTGRRVALKIGPSKVHAKIWCLTVGRVPLYLLDADLPENSPADRRLTHHLYAGGDPEYRIRQEVLLGIGGLMALDALGIAPTVHHLNEGHAAFCPLERLRRLIKKGTPPDKAMKSVRASSVFTTHTPVPEGNDRFEPAALMKHLPGFDRDLSMTRQQFLGLGREDPTDTGEPFCMTVLALRLSERCNGVAALHGDTSRRMWMKTYGAARPEDVPIGHVTNGVHPESWIADEARPFYDRYLRPRWTGAGPEDDCWKNIARAPVEEAWALRCTLRRRMVAWLRDRLRAQMIAGHLAPADLSHLSELCEILDEDALTIGFARRFATYKRAPLIFREPKRLARIVGDAKRPVQFVFAGKAHPQDKDGQEFVRQVFEHSRRLPFRGRIYIVQNYDTHVGRMLTSGCDVWLNNPVRPMEASGTSGMKPPLNLGINCSILDGWWPEGYNRRNGWALGGGRRFDDRRRQDEHDARAIYDTLEKQVVPLFYTRDRRGVPRGWMKTATESMRSICRDFSTHRMVAQYTRDYYLR